MPIPRSPRQAYRLLSGSVQGSSPHYGRGGHCARAELRADPPRVPSVTSQPELAGRFLSLGGALKRD